MNIGRRYRYLVLLALAAAAGIAIAVVHDELRTSERQARYFSKLAAEMWFWTGPGASPSIRYPQNGPYDHRLGYSRLPELIPRLASRGFQLDSQARQTPALANFIERGYSAPYREKTHAGLALLDCRAEPLHRARHPLDGYESFDAIPPLIVESLLFIENRTLLDPSQPRRNPAVEWPRLTRALLGRGLQWLGVEDNAPGGSTLATQLEKYRHSPLGITSSATDKFRQMYSASLKAYAAGPDTLPARRAILLDYVNSVPLAAAPGHGEVNGIPEGLRTWYSMERAAVDAALRSHAGGPGYSVESRARAYRAVLSLLVAQRRPTYLLTQAPDRLHALTDSYLRLLGDAGIISAELRDAALRVSVPLQHGAAVLAAATKSWKAGYAVRAELAALMGETRFYDLERLDLQVESTFHSDLQDAIRQTLERLGRTGEGASENSGTARLLGDADPSHIIYSFTLYERGQNANHVRVQTDTGDRPFDVNEGARIELGSTAKLRTLATYLDLLATLYARYAPLDAEALARVEVDKRDRLSLWVLDYLARNAEAPLPDMLQAALERRYSAHPGERFFTGGGRHRFSNFSSRDNARAPTVAEAFRDSINLPFVRLMRDIVNHHIYGAPRSAGALLDDPDHPERAVYLARFADHEGTIFLRRFYDRHRGDDADEALEALARRAHAIPARLAVMFRSVYPQAPIDRFAEFLTRHAPQARLDDGDIAALYERYAIERFSLHDRGYIASVHPLELWLVGFLAQHPQARFEDAVAASADERQAVYQWLFKRSQRAQNPRIRTLLEIEAFETIHAQWARLGYPFGALVPSYATAIGVSGDNPAALSELIGVIVNDGMRYPTQRIEALHFARVTPYETVLRRERAAGQRVLHEAAASALRAALADVVENGTARRVRGVYSDAAGEPLAIGGKTGTGDNRYKVFGNGGTLVSSRSVSRTATFAFFLGDRHFGVATAYVPAPFAEDYRFTSGLPVQIVRDLAPLLLPMLEARSGSSCGMEAQPSAL